MRWILGMICGGSRDGNHLESAKSDDEREERERLG